MSLPESKLSMFVDRFYIPKVDPAKLRARGDDAHFFHREAQIIGVAAGEYALLLMKNAVLSINNSKSASIDDPKSLLTNAFEKTKTTFPHTSTACIISLDGNRLRAANVGDNGFVVIRKGTTIFRSPVQYDEFNDFPINPKDAEEMTVDLQSGDIVVAATRGLFDNIDEETVERVLNDDKMPWGTVAYKLADTARRNSIKKNEMAANKAGFKHSRQKHDDITVVVAYVIARD